MQVSRGSYATALALTLLSGTLVSCGEQEGSQLKERVDIGTGVFERHSIVERSTEITNDAQVGHIEALNYYPTTLPKTNADGSSRFGEDIFWTFQPGTAFTIKADPQKVLPDQKLLEAQLSAGMSYPTGAFIHNEFDELARTGEQWKIEFQPHFRIKGQASSGTPVRLKIQELWVCSQFLADGTISILDEKRRDAQSDPVNLRTSFQDLKLPLEVLGRDMKAFEKNCQTKQGEMAFSLELRVEGAENEMRSLQFVELRVIKEQSF